MNLNRRLCRTSIPRKRRDNHNNNNNKSKSFENEYPTFGYFLHFAIVCGKGTCSNLHSSLVLSTSNVTSETDILAD